MIERRIGNTNSLYISAGFSSTENRIHEYPIRTEYMKMLITETVSSVQAKVV